MAVQEKQSFINSSTLLPISLVITLLAAAVGFGNFIGAFGEMKEANRKNEMRIERLEEHLQRLSGTVYRLESLEREVIGLRNKIEKK